MVIEAVETLDCVEQHPQSSAVAGPDVIAQIEACESDTGMCRASRPPCAGTAEGRNCDADALITASAALCIAEAEDMPPGLSGLQAELVYNFGYRRIIWNVRNVLFDGDRGTRPEAVALGSSGGAVLAIDAISAEPLDMLYWSANPAPRPR